jgi:DNA-directed RNA polymerase specialized sigma24 family protein
MDSRPFEAQLERLRPKRSQKYQGFALQAGDQELINQLSARQQEILLAKGDYSELSSQLGIPLGTVRSRLHRARAALTKLRQGIHGSNEEKALTAH